MCIHCMISTLFDLIRYVLWPKIWSTLVSVQCELRRMCILLLLGEIFYKCQLHSIDWSYCWVQLCLYWCSSCWYCPLLTKGYLTSNIIINLSISPCSSITFFLKYFHTWFLGTYTLKIAMSSWIIDPFITVNCSFIPDNFPCQIGRASCRERV